MAEFNLGKVVGEKGDIGTNGQNGASVWIKYNSLPQDDGASDIWQDGMDYIGVQTAVADVKPTTGYMWAVFAKGSTPYDGLDSTEVSVPLSANQGRVLQSNIDDEVTARANADTQLQANIDTKQDKLMFSSYILNLYSSGNSIDIPPNSVASIQLDNLPSNVPIYRVVVTSGYTTLLAHLNGNTVYVTNAQTMSRVVEGVTFYYISNTALSAKYLEDIRVKSIEINPDSYVASEK